jgi:homoserine kinase
VRVGAPVTVRVPATSANLGPGFDSFGLALALYDVVTVEAVAPSDVAQPLRVAVSGEGAGGVPLDESHLVVRAIRVGLAHAGVPQPALRVECLNAVPHGRGLGSSAAAFVAGLVAARELLAEPSVLDDDAVFALATAAEGHPDNAAAAVFGGFTLAWSAPSGRPRCVRLDVDAAVRLVVCLPQARLATTAARAMLPPAVPHLDAAFTAGRAGLLVEALTRRPELLLDATEERLHQEHRAAAMPATAEVVAGLRARGHAAVVSGAGPAVLVLCGSPEEAAAASREARELVREPEAACPEGGWAVLTPEVDRTGACVVPA